MTLQHKTIVLDNGFRVGVVQAGPRHGIPLVFLHGWSVSAQAYAELIEELAALDYRVTAIDAPNHGNSGSLRWGHSIKDMAGVVYDALYKLKIKRPIMVGHSMGGGIVAEYAGSWPNDLSAAILVNAAVGQQHHEAIQMALTPEGLLRAAELITGALRDIVGDARAAGEIRSVRELLSLGSSLAKSLSGVRMLRAGIALLKSDTELALHRMKVWGVPVAILHGGDDRIIDERAAYQAACKSGAKLCIYSNRNHSWMIASPAFAAAQIGAWARKLTKAVA